jgi:hypothetical protein
MTLGLSIPPPQRIEIEGRTITLYGTADGWWYSQPGDERALQLAREANLPMLTDKGQSVVCLPSTIIRVYHEMAAKAGVELLLQESVA